MKLLHFSVSRASWLTHVALIKNNRENILIHYKRAQSSFEPTPSLCKKPVLIVLPKAHNYSLDTEVKTFLSKLCLFLSILQNKCITPKCSHPQASNILCYLCYHKLVSAISYRFRHQRFVVGDYERLWFELKPFTYNTLIPTYITLHIILDIQKMTQSSCPF